MPNSETEASRIRGLWHRYEKRTEIHEGFLSLAARQLCALKALKISFS